MTDDNKQAASFKIIRRGLLIITIMSFIIPIAYFTLTVPSSLVLDNINKTVLHRENIGRFYEWGILLQLVAVVALLSLLYLTTTIKLLRAWSKLIAGCTAFIKQISLSEAIISAIIISLTVFTLSLIIRELYCNCSDWWIILSARLSDSEEPLNFRNIIIGVAGAVTLVFAWQRIIIADEQKEDQVQQTKSHVNQTINQVRQTDIEAGRRLSERFDNAVKALSKELNESSFPAHLGAISGLQTLAIDSPKYTQICLDIICSCNQWMEEYLDEFIEKGSNILYCSLLLNEDNRIAKKVNQNTASKITLLQEKRSQEALKSISYILTEVSTKRLKQLKILNFYNKMLCGIFLEDIKLENIDFQRTYLVTAALDNISLNKVELSHANLKGASLRKSNLQNTSLRGAKLQGASLESANLQNVPLMDAKLQGASLESVNLHNVSLDGANLQGANLRAANLYGVDLHNTNLQNVDLCLADLQWANLRDADLQRALLNNANLQGASLMSAKLQGASLDGVKLQETHLNNAKLQGSSLRGIKLQGASLNNVNLQGAFLIDANLQGSSLNNVNLQNALLINTQLQGATMNKVDLSNTIILDCNLYDVTLEDIRGENIIFNGILKIGYIEDKEKRRKWIDEVYQDIGFEYVKLFTEKMESAWKAMEKLQEPEELGIIIKSPIATKDNQGMYDISPQNLANLQKIWQKRVDEQGLSFLHSVRKSLSLLTDKDVILVTKLRVLLDQLIDSNKK